ncbi:GIY-YIG nuclease family protein [Herbaspirillum sp. SJZ107]|uniref:GIY-YIG nuclease family protein n=1 Tax=Herbaspirillum sp. SJZ107 TaxID=2572881 RepID=UPI002106943C|nr:GIY-YIG nuclease family protein [Herbaspirillum sp. SJZ107]
MAALSSRCVDMEKSSYVYMMANTPYGTLYVGSTTNLVQRIWQHREGVIEGFTKLHGLKRLVWYEVHGEIMDAGLREKQIKLWKRDWKVNLIQEMNPEWRDLYEEIVR